MKARDRGLLALCSLPTSYTATHYIPHKYHCMHTTTCMLKEWNEQTTKHNTDRCFPAAAATRPDKTHHNSRHHAAALPHLPLPRAAFLRARQRVGPLLLRSRKWSARRNWTAHPTARDTAPFCGRPPTQPLHLLLDEALRDRGEARLRERRGRSSSQTVLGGVHGPPAGRAGQDLLHCLVWGPRGAHRCGHGREPG